MKEKCGRGKLWPRCERRRCRSLAISPIHNKKIINTQVNWKEKEEKDWVKNHIVSRYWGWYWKIRDTGCSGKSVLFSTTFQNFATSPSPALGFYWLYRTWSANKSDCKLRYLAQMSCSPTCNGYGLQLIGKKKHNFSWRPCIYFDRPETKSWTKLENCRLG